MVGSLQSRLHRLEGRAVDDAELIVVGTEDEADSIRARFLAGGQPRPCVIVAASDPPPSPQPWGKLSAMLARVAIYGRQVHESTQ